MAIRLDITASTRREWLQRMGLLGGTALLGGLPGLACNRSEPATETTSGADAADADVAAEPGPLDAQRAQMGSAPVERMELGPGLTLLTGPGGNVVVLSGADGKVVVDTFVLPAWGALNAALEELGTGAVATVINTHWHFDHTDNNAHFRHAGAQVLAHENTAKRMSASQELLGMQLEPSPLPARPTRTFASTESLQANGNRIELAYMPPAHTDTDITVHYTDANVLHAGDLMFNGMYPFFDAGTGGNINGMVAAAGRMLKMVNARTRIVPGHGPLADRDALARYRDMLATSRDRVQKLKTAGRTLEDVQKARPTADLDDAWGGGFMTPDDYVALVYTTL